MADSATVRGWVRQVGRRRFVYTVKVSELITHVRRFARTKMLIRDFGHIADLLGPHMGCFLFQLPPSFHYSRARLERILSQLDPARRNVVEFRHRSWWQEQVFAAFRAAERFSAPAAGPGCLTSWSRRPTMSTSAFTESRQWYRHDYSTEELAVWAKRIETSGARRVWVYFNNDRNGYAIKNARTLLRSLSKSY